MKTTFPKEQKLKTETTTESSKALTEVVEQPLALSTNAGMEGEFNVSDFQIPRLNIANKTGDLSNDFPPGSIVFRKEVLVGNQKSPAK